MSLDSKNSQLNNELTEEDYSRAMNFIGQNLLASLTQTVEQLSPELRNRKVVAQGLAAFLANVIHKQFPQEPELCSKMLEEFSAQVRVHLELVSA